MEGPGCRLERSNVRARVQDVVRRCAEDGCSTDRGASRPAKVARRQSLASLPESGGGVEVEAEVGHLR